VHTEPASSGRTSWEDAGVAPLTTYFYRLVAVKGEGADERTSAPSELAAGRASDMVPPSPAEWGSAEWVKIDNNGGEHPWSTSVDPFTPAIKLVWVGVAPGDDVLLQRKEPADLVWKIAKSWSLGTLTYLDQSVSPELAYLYRVQVRKANGLSAMSDTFERSGVA